MGNTGLAPLGELRLASQQRADMVNSNFLTPNEWNTNLTRSYKELYDILITHYGDDYMVAPPYSFLTNSANNLYSLPDGLTTVDTVTSTVAAPFYKLLGMDLSNAATPSGYITMRRFEFTERNKWWDFNQTVNAYGILVPRYKVFGSNIWIPSPIAGQIVRMWFIPKPTNLQATVVLSLTGASAVVQCSETTQLAAGMSVADLIVPQGASPIIPVGATIVSIVPNVSFTMSVPAGSSVAGFLASAWSDLTTLDGISGWEDYVVIDAAIKALGKEESDVTALMAEKEAMRMRIGAAAENRDASMPARVTDTQGANAGFEEMGLYGLGGMYP